MAVSGYESQTDRELAIGAANGDTRAFASLYDRHFTGIHDFAARMLMDAASSADVTEDTFAEAWRSLGQHRVPGQVKAWLYSLARDASLARIRSQPRAATVSPGAPAPAFAEADPTRGAAGQAPYDPELRQLAWQSAAALDPNEYALLDMHLRHDLGPAELGEGLQVSEENAQMMLGGLRNTLDQDVAAALLAHNGQQCPELAELLSRSAASPDSSAVARAVLAHAGSCAVCEAANLALPAGSDIYATLALVPAPAGLQEITWSNVAALSAAAAPVAAVPEERKRRRWWLWALGGLVAATAVAAVIALLLSGDETGLQDPDDVRSTSHETAEPSEDNVVEIVWSRQEGVQAYSIEWTEDEFTLPDETGELSGDATDATSDELDPGRWYFHLRTQGDDGAWTSTVHEGPFVIVEPETPSPVPTEEPEPEPTEELEPTDSPPPTAPPTPEPTEPATPTPAGT
jgi:RNA polymerase sigma factor (sigma-70 family)